MSGSLKPLRQDSVETQTDRRTLMKVGAWSVPVIAVAVATPAAAASTTPPVIITADMLVLQDFSAKLVVCGGEQFVDTSITITTSDGREIPAGSTMTFKFDAPENASESEESFGGVVIGHAEDTVSTEGRTVNRMVAVFSWIGDIFGLASVSAAEPQQVTKTWEVDIEEAEPETYSTENFTYAWHGNPEDLYYFTGSFDLGQNRCGGDVLAGTHVSYDVSALHGISTTVDAESHVELATSAGIGMTKSDHITVRIGDWSTTLDTP